jgi:methyl-accepting chemotaxis protein
MSIRTKIILLPLCVALLVAILMGIGMYKAERTSLEMIHNRELEVAENWLTASVQGSHKEALARAELIAALPPVQRAVADRDDMALERLLAPGFPKLLAETGLVQLQLHTPPATSLIRIHKLEKRGDDLSAFRQTVVDANTSGQSLSGLERGRAGIGARGVAVIEYEGAPVGTVEVGLSLGTDFLTDLSAQTGYQYEYYAMPDGDIAVFDETTNGELRLGTTLDHPPLLSADDLAGLRTGPSLDRDIIIDGAHYAMRAVAVRDYSGAVAGVITVATSTEPYEAIGQELLTIALIASVAALAVGAGVGLVTGRTLAGQIAHVADMTERLAHRDPDVEITGTDRKDELGNMARALAMFHDKLAENERLEAALKVEEDQVRAREEADRSRAAKAEAERHEAERREAARAREIQDAKARAAQAEQAEAEARLREQEEVVNLLAAGLSALADGNLTHAIDQALPGDYEMLRHDFNRALAQLAGTMQKIKDAAGTINGEVAAVASASDDLSRRSERNAATLEQTAAALDELTASVRSAAQSASEARRLTEDANRNADDGSDSVGQVVEAMARIETSSQGIEKITGVIDEIAFQTNLLALNAGVEAARAGEAGRGFAVVASEVRALAQRSSEAAKEISELIRSSGDEVKQGVELVGHTGRALDRILASVRDISDQVSSIANSSTEQATGLAEINEAMNQLDSTTQQNAAMFEETNAATALLSGKSAELVAAVGMFRLTRDQIQASDAINAA